MTGDYPYYPAVSPRAVKDGIKAKSRRGAIGERWWSKRFIETLERMGDGARLKRGKTYARKGQVISLSLSAGEVKSRVQGSRRTPYEVTIRLRPFSDQAWGRVFDHMAEEAIYSAQLLAGEVPPEIEKVIGDTGVSLFPGTKREITTTCSCPDWENPCKHIAAVYYLLAERFDDDPFLLFLLRGRTRDEVMAALKARREAEPFPVQDGVQDVAGEFWRGRVAPDELGFAITRDVQVEGSTLKLCGDSPFSLRGKNLAEILLPIYPAARAAAFVLATGRDQSADPEKGPGA
ncbi:MAG: hypothetical protein PWP08_690 [Methanofollis sp.]|nr:hypothetical protein [Methanofollis sp.]